MEQVTGLIAECILFESYLNIRLKKKKTETAFSSHYSRKDVYMLKHH